MFTQACTRRPNHRTKLQRQSDKGADRSATESKDLFSNNLNTVTQERPLECASIGIKSCEDMPSSQDLNCSKNCTRPRQSMPACNHLLAKHGRDLPATLRRAPKPSREEEAQGTKLSRTHARASIKA